MRLIKAIVNYLKEEFVCLYIILLSLIVTAIGAFGIILGFTNHWAFLFLFPLAFIVMGFGVYFLGEIEDRF